MKSIFKIFFLAILFIGVVKAQILPNGGGSTSGGGGGAVSSVFNRTGDVAASSNDYLITQVNHATDSLATKVDKRDSSWLYLTKTNGLSYAPKASPTFTGIVTTPLGAGTVRSSSGGVLSVTASDTTGLGALIALYAKLSNNLSDLPSASTARTNLGLGTLATQSGTFSGTSSGTNTGDQTITLTSDVTGSGTGSFAATIANNAVTNAKAAQASANTIKGNNTGSIANEVDLTVSQAKTLLGFISSYTDSIRVGPAQWTSVSAIDTLPICYVWTSGMSIQSIFVQRTAGTSASVNVIRVRAGTAVSVKASAISTTTVGGYLGSWDSGTADQNQTLLIGDNLYAVITAISGTATSLSVQVMLTKSR